MRIIYTILLLLVPVLGLSQNEMDKVLRTMNAGSVPYMKVDEAQSLANVVYLDAREVEEYQISHLKNAIYVGYDDFDLKIVEKAVPDKNTQVVVYCSIGVRSEDIGERLLAAGYTNVTNLYGGIFEWKNKGNPIYDSSGSTEAVHAYDRHWGRLLKQGKKVY